MPFDPSKPFTVDSQAARPTTSTAPPAFDPSKPFEVQQASPGGVANMTIRPNKAVTGGEEIPGLEMKPPSNGSSVAQPERPGALQSIGEGLMTPMYGAAQLAEHLVPINGALSALGVPGVKSTAEIDKQMDKRKHDLLAEDNGHINWLRIAGEVASPINYVGGLATKGMTELGNLARSTLAGMWSGTIEPSDAKDGFARDKTKQIAEGAVGGVAGHVAGAGFSKLVNPLSADAALLTKEGVRLTPGEVVGGIGRRAEEAMRSVPLFGQAVRHGESLSRQDFNIAAYNRALAPIGEKYTSKEVGHEGIANVERMIGDAYDRVLPHVSFRADQTLANDLRNLRTLASEMPPDHAHQLEAIWQNRVWQRLQPTGTMDGKTFKQVESELSTMSARLRPSRDMADRQLGDAIDEMNSLLRQNLARQNPAQQAELQAANESWMMYARLRRAAANRVTSSGEFTPVDLLSALKGSDTSAGKGRFAKGQAPMQDLAGAGSRVLRSTLSDSGTPERHLWTGMLGSGAAAGGAAYGASHGVSPEAIIALAGPAGLYTGPGMSALRAATNFMQPGRAAVAPYFLDPALGAAGGAVAGGQQ